MNGKRLLVIALVGMMALAPVVAATTGHPVNHDAKSTPKPDISTNVTKATHEVGWDPVAYEANNGSMAHLNAEINSSVDNPYWFEASEVNFSDAGAFPHAKKDVSILDASEWSKDLNGSAGSGSISDVTTTSGVDAVELSTSSQTSGDTAVFTMANFSVTSDTSKRYLQSVYDVESIGSGTGSQLRAVDGDGDYYAIDINQSTGQGYISQTQLGSMSMVSAGDGSFGNIEKLQVVINDSDETVRFAALNTERMSEWQFGEHANDTDDDGTLEKSTITENPDGGALHITSPSSMGPAFSNATIHNLGESVVFEAKDLAAEDVAANFTKTDTYPGYHGTASIYYRMKLPSAYDLSYTGASLVDRQSATEDRYETVEYAEGTGSTNFSDISDSSWSAITGDYSGVGTNVTVDDTVQPGNAMVLHYNMKLTKQEFNAMKSTGAAGGFGSSRGGLLGSILSPFGAIMTALGGLLWKKKRSGGN
ncbi:MAG: hypothetical protein ABEI77_07550 [Halorientalis sp.]